MEFKKEIIRWYLDVCCFPTWQEILEVEYVRKHANINMFTDDVIEQFKRHKFKNAIEWYKRLNNVGVMPSSVFGEAVQFYSQERGHIDTWPNPEALNES